MFCFVPNKGVIGKLVEYNRQADAFFKEATSLLYAREIPSNVVKSI